MQRGEAVLSVIIPAHNEEKRLEPTVRALEKELGRMGKDYEIIIAEDGSSDHTLSIARHLENERIRVLHSDARLGKGKAVQDAALSARGGIIAFMDADLAADLSGLPALVGSVENGAPIAIGSRYVPGSATRRKFLRGLYSRAFNLAVSLLWNSRVKDHQCGFKAFRGSAVLPWIREVQSKSWFWDAEFLVRAQEKGIPIAEIPIRWNEAASSEFRFLDILGMMGSIMGFRLFRK
ncbi:MAG: glycosyltransferase family 2 protein [Candidatus ainarchaeum sp.]|nr:glycosyltransferase family 2 protein [Candidatus ainarchaeum sp.]